MTIIVVILNLTMTTYDADDYSDDEDIVFVNDEDEHDYDDDENDEKDSDNGGVIGDCGGSNGR